MNTRIRYTQGRYVVEWGPGYGNKAWFQSREVAEAYIASILEQEEGQCGFTESGLGDRTVCPRTKRYALQ